MHLIIFNITLWRTCCYIPTTQPIRTLNYFNFVKKNVLLSNCQVISWMFLHKALHHITMHMRSICSMSWDNGTKSKVKSSKMNYIATKWMPTILKQMHYRERNEWMKFKLSIFISQFYFWFLTFVKWHSWKRANVESLNWLTQEVRTNCIQMSFVKYNIFRKKDIYHSKRFCNCSPSYLKTAYIVVSHYSLKQWEAS